MTAAERLATLDSLPADELCRRALGVLDSLVAVMNEETTLLRAGRFRETGPVTAEKTALAQDYVGLVRSIQRQTGRLLKEAPEEVRLLRAGHERLATQMAENLKVLATARAVTDEVLTDVAAALGQRNQARTYGASGELPQHGASLARGIALNRAL
jgi:hypothetical protein